MRHYRQMIEGWIRNGFIKKSLDEMQRIYYRHHPYVSEIKDIRIDQLRKIERRREEFLSYDFFKLREYKVLSHKVTYSTERYMNLLRTFSFNSTQDEGVLDCIRLLVPDSKLPGLQIPAQTRWSV